MDGTAQHLKFWFEIQEELSSCGISTASFHAAYTLMPHASYPMQFSEAVEAFRYVLEDLGRKPGEVLLVGDSAGANLCLAVLSSLSHPSSDVRPIRVHHSVKGMILMSPWLSFDSKWRSMVYNLKKDIETIGVLQNWSQEYLSGKPSDNSTEAILAHPEWWVNAKVDHTLVVAGGDEVLIDSITLWVNYFQVGSNLVSRCTSLRLSRLLVTK
jgi:acetyl esterase/lipase